MTCPNTARVSPAATGRLLTAKSLYAGMTSLLLDRCLSVLAGPEKKVDDRRDGVQRTDGRAAAPRGRDHRLALRATGAGPRAGERSHVKGSDRTEHSQWIGRRAHDRGTGPARPGHAGQRRASRQAPARAEHRSRYARGPRHSGRPGRWFSIRPAISTSSPITASRGGRGSRRAGLDRTFYCGRRRPGLGSRR